MGREPSIPLRGGSNGHHIYGLSLCIRLWPLAPVNSPLKIYFELALQTHTNLKFRSLAFSPCGRIVAVTTNNHDVLLFTTRSESIRLGTQCLHAIRKCVVENLLKKTMHRSIKHQYHNNDLSLTTSNNSYNTLFQNCISQIHLPSPVKKAILRNFVN
ncbi:unnamed protein product [Schistosoma mattheei]|nr:unnamed protein product [Schistosoma mattheei]